MFSRIFSSLFFSFLVVIIGACSQEDHPYFATPSVAISGSSCLDNMAAGVERYLAGRSNPAEVKFFWQCQRQALSAFSDSTQGSTADRHSAQELQNFLQTYFVQQTNLTDRFMNEALELKSLIVGGSSSYISKAELKQAIQRFDQLETMTIELLPHVGNLRALFSYEKRQQLDPQDVQVAITAFEKVTGQLMDILQANHHPYNLDHLKALLEEVDKLVLETGATSSLREIISLIPLLSETKSLLVGGPEDIIESNSWPLLGHRLSTVFRLLILGEDYFEKTQQNIEITVEQLQTIKTCAKHLLLDYDGHQIPPNKIDLQAVDVLLDRMVVQGIFRSQENVNMIKDGLRIANSLISGGQGSPSIILISNWSQLVDALVDISHPALQFTYSDSDSPWYQPKRWMNLTNLIENTFFQLELGISRSPRRAIDYKTIRLVSDFLAKYRYLPDGFDQEVAFSATQLFIDKIFAVTGSGHILPPQGGLSKARLDLIRSEVRSWYEGQEYINALFATQISHDNEAVDLDKYPGAIQLREVASAPWPLRLDSSGRLIYDWKAPSVSYDHKSLTTLNWQRTLVDSLMRAYSRDRKSRAIANSLDLAEFESLAKDAAPFLTALGLPLDNPTVLAKKIFREANLFTTRSRNDRKLSMTEGVEYLAYILSGNNATHMLIAELGDKCGSSEQEAQDSSSTNHNPTTTKLDAACFRREVLAHEDAVFSHLPNLQQYLSSYDFNPVLWQVMEKNMEELVRTNGYSQQPISYSELSHMMILLQYVETIMGRFDSDHDGTLGTGEIWSAFSFYNGWSVPNGDEGSLLGFIPSAHASDLTNSSPLPIERPLLQEQETAVSSTPRNQNQSHIKSVPMFRGERVNLLRLLNYF